MSSAQKHASPIPATALCLTALYLVFAPAAAAQDADFARAMALVRNHQWDDGLQALAPSLKRDPNDIKVLNLEGLALTGKGDIKQADEYFAKAIAISPGFVPALKNLSVNEFNLHEFADAEKHLLAAQKLAPADPVVNLYLGELAYRQHNYQQAAEDYDRARELAMRNADAMAHMAVIDLKTGQSQAAVELLDHLQPDQITDSRSQFELGLALQEAGRPERSLPWLQAVRQRNPDSYEIGFDLVLGQIAAKQFAAAIATAQDLIHRGHETSELNNLLAEAYAGNNQAQQAVDAYRRAIALDPQDEDNYLDFAELCMSQRSLQAGMTVIEVGLKTHPKSNRLIFMRGVLHATQDEFELAEKDFRLSAELAPQADLGFVGLGVTYLERGDAKHAAEVLRDRLKTKPNDASLLYLLGEALLRSGAAPGDAAYKEAQADLEKSVRINPNLCLPHVSLGTIYLDEDNPKDAVVQFEEARSMDPKERSAYSHLAVAYRRLGEADKSKEVLTALQQMIAGERRTTRDKMKTAAQEEAQQGAEARKP